VAGWLALLLILPPQHEYPIIDDWIYAGAARHLAATGVFQMPAMAQANLVGQSVWGAGWIQVFGFSFTVLTYSTLILALAGLLACYGIARALSIAPSGAILATALIGLNPLWVHLSYSFMTDVPFMAALLLACWCYLRGLQEGNEVLLLVGGVFTGWAFTIRQFGLLVPLAFGALLLLDGLRTRRWRWRALLALAVMPALIIAVWYGWSRDIPMSGAAVSAAHRAALYVFHEPWLRVFVLRAGNVLPLLALFAAVALPLWLPRWGWIAGWAVLGVVGVYAADLPTETWLAITAPPFTARFGPLALVLPQEVYTFATSGNIIRVEGINFFEYRQVPIWTPEVWRALWVGGFALAVLLLAHWSQALLGWLRARPWRAPLPLGLAFYGLGALIFVVSLAFPGDLYDRYIVAFLPFAILVVVQMAGPRGRLAWTGVRVALVVFALITVLLKADAIDHDNARWQAGQWMFSRVHGGHVGYDWDNWVGNRRSEYEVTDVPIAGYRTEHQVSYTSRLEGGITRTVLVQARADQPPMPP
jgi:4-amino-4-deoxy-L-arabinose transferase-like glycosyltransferase